MRVKIKKGVIDNNNQKRPDWLENEWFEVTYEDNENIGVIYGTEYPYEYKKEYIIERKLD